MIQNKYTFEIRQYPSVLFNGVRRIIVIAENLSTAKGKEIGLIEDLLKTADGQYRPEWFDNNFEATIEPYEKERE